MSLVWDQVGVTQVDCAECERLWKAYEASVFEHVRRSGRLRIAEASGDSSAFTKLASDVDEAALQRFDARKALMDHERAAGHGQSSSVSGI